MLIPHWQIHVPLDAHFRLSLETMLMNNWFLLKTSVPGTKA